MTDPYIDPVTLGIYARWFIKSRGYAPPTLVVLGQYLKYEHSRGDFPDWVGLRTVLSMAQRPGAEQALRIALAVVANVSDEEPHTGDEDEF
jgi:hypothetical protein